MTRWRRRQVLWPLAAAVSLAAYVGNFPAPGVSRTAAGTWRPIADGPLRGAYGRLGAWTGSEVLVWGGTRMGRDFEPVPLRGGAAYTPATDSWREIPRAPIRGGSGYSATWTGFEMIVWGDRDRGRSTKGNRGAAFDPVTDTWRRIPAGPLAARADHFAVWTGTELVVWGGGLTGSARERYAGDGASYDPATDEWRVLPDAPLPAGYDVMGAWTGEEVVVLVSPTGTGSSDYPKFAEAAAYDPAARAWRDLASPPFVTWVSAPAAFLDGELFLLSLGGEVDGGETDPYDKSYATGGILDTRSGEWRTHSQPPEPPEQPDQTWEQTALDDEVVIDGLAYDPATDSWRTLPEPPLEPREFPVIVWTGDELIVWGGAAMLAGDPPPPLDDGAAYSPPG